MSALCLTIFISGCVKTETVIVTKTVGTLPPPYLYTPETLPELPAGLAPSERAAFFVEAYASRGDAITRANSRVQRLQEWVRHIESLYPGSTVEPLPEAGKTASDPESGGSGDT